MTTITWPALLRTLLRGEALTTEETAWAMNEIMEGAASPAQIAGFGIALRAKGETPSEMLGLASAMLARATPIAIPGPATDLVGTGGDGAHTVNISTMATIVAAASGVPMVKHGNRAASSKCGAADVLETLGVLIDLPPEASEALFAEVGVVFLFASLYHPSFRHAGPVRKDLGVPTAFNYLGPLTNPAQPGTVAAGVADPVMGAVLAGTFAERGNTALVFHGSGLDELTTTGSSKVWVVAGGAVSETDFDPASIGLPRATLDDLRGGDARRNAEVVRTLLAGERGPVRDIVLLNAAAAITVSEGLSFAAPSPASPGPASSSPASSDAASPDAPAPDAASPDAASPGALAPSAASPDAPAPDAPAVADGLTKALADGFARAAQAIDSGAAADLLQRWSAASHRLSTPRPR